jgi:uncharacterized protein
VVPFQIANDNDSMASRGPDMHYHGIEIDAQQIAHFCRRHGIRKFSLFGSILREDFGPESDIDVLVEFCPDRTPTLLTVAGMELELTRMLGRKADLRTAEDLSRYFREEVLRQAGGQYAA